MPESTTGIVSMSTFILQRTPSSVLLATSNGAFQQNINFLAFRCN